MQSNPTRANQANARDSGTHVTADSVSTDEHLVLSARIGDSTRFDALIERHFELVFAVALARVGNRETAEDIVQDAFLRAYANLNSLSQPRYFSTWVVRIARNLA